MSEEHTEFLLITVRARKEEQAILEIGDALFKHDPKITPVKTRYPGVIIVYTNISVIKAYRILLNQTLAYPLKIYPLNTSLEKTLEKIEKTMKIYIQCEHRGHKEKCREHTKNILKKIPLQNTTKTKKQSTHTLHIQAIDNTTAYTLLPTNCENYNKTIQNKTLKEKCTQQTKEEKMAAGPPSKSSGGWI